MPGIGRSWGEHSLQEIAEDLAYSLDTRHAKGITFYAAPTQGLSYGPRGRGRTARAMTISWRGDGGQPGQSAPVIDLFELDYLRDLTAEQENKPTMVRALLVLLALVLGLQRIIPMLTPRRKGKTGRERVQILLAAFLLVLYAAFFLILFVSIFHMIATVASQTLGGAPPQATDGQPPASAGGGVGGWLWSAAVLFRPPFAASVDGLSQSIALAGALAWLVLPPKTRIKNAITNYVTDYLASDFYLREGAGAARLHGNLVGLIDAVRDRPEGRYRAIYLVTYSFGSILALNALFPRRNGTPPHRVRGGEHALAGVDALVTIGCPFDFVRLLRPNYFEMRGRRSAGTPRRGWLNIYNPSDILGSNFRNDDELLDPDAKVIEQLGNDGLPPPENQGYFPGGAPQEGNVLSLLLLRGFAAHGQYWEPGQSGEHTCFDLIVDFLYPPGTVEAPLPQAASEPETAPSRMVMALERERTGDQHLVAAAHQVTVGT